jgi:hypothetical protein
VTDSDCPHSCTKTDSVGGAVADSVGGAGGSRRARALPNPPPETSESTTIACAPARRDRDGRAVGPRPAGPIPIGAGLTSGPTAGGR